MKIKIDDTPIDTLTVKLWRDQPGPLYKGNKPPEWACHIGIDIVQGVGGFGATPLLALKNLCETIGRDEGHRTDSGKLFLR